MPENVAFLIYFFKSFPTVYESSRSDKNWPMQISKKSSGLSDQVETSQNAASDGKQRFQRFSTQEAQNGLKCTLGTPLDESPKKIPAFFLYSYDISKSMKFSRTPIHLLALKPGDFCIAGGSSGGSAMAVSSRRKNKFGNNILSQNILEKKNHLLYLALCCRILVHCA